MDELHFSGKVVVVTGASSGFGRGLALGFATRGASVMAVARRAGLLNELSVEAAADGHRIHVRPTDVGKPEEMEKLMEETLAAFGHVDVWINNAGVGAVGPFEQIPLEENARVIQTDLMGTLYGSHHALAHFRKRGLGTLINVASIAGKLPMPYWAAYCAAKFGIVGLSDSLRQEIRQEQQQDIHVCTVMPMAMDTPFFEHMANHSGHAATPVPPLYDPQMVIDAILALATRPQPEIIVGTAGRLINALHQLAPASTETLMGAQTRHAQLNAPPAGNTSGAVLQPMHSGTQVNGGLRS